MVLPKKGLYIAKVWSPSSGLMDNWSGCMMRGKARDMLVITVYLKDGEGLSQTNLTRLGQIHGILRASKVPWIIMGDFNMTPATLDQDGFLDLVGGTVVTAAGGSPLAPQAKEIYWTM
jgi:hypothetical protein